MSQSRTILLYHSGGFILGDSATQMPLNEATSLACVELIKFSIISYLLFNMQDEKKESILFNHPDQSTAHEHVSFLSTASCLFFKNLPFVFLILSSPI